MEVIQTTDLLDQVVRLTPDQRLFIDFPKDVCNKLELLGLQIKSDENLFQSYLNNTHEVASEMNLKTFLDTHAERIREKDELFLSTILKCLGTIAYNYIMSTGNTAFYSLDTKINKLVIGKRPINVR